MLSYNNIPHIAVVRQYPTYCRHTTISYILPPHDNIPHIAVIQQYSPYCRRTKISHILPSYNNIPHIAVVRQYLTYCRHTNTPHIDAILQKSAPCKIPTQPDFHKNKAQKPHPTKYGILEATSSTARHLRKLSGTRRRPKPQGR